MKVLIDVQGAQSSSALRGIGRYASALTEGIIRQSAGDDIHVLLNEAFPETAIALRARFGELLGADHVHSFSPVLGNSIPYGHDSRAWRATANEALRDAAISRIAPDVVLVTSLFEGRTDDAVVSAAGRGRWATAVVLYDLIPYVFPDTYLVDPGLTTWYRRRVEQLREADLLLAISEHSRSDAIEHLGALSDQVVNISGAVDPALFGAHDEPAQVDDVRRRFQLDKPYLMYTGGSDYRKNLDRLIKSYAHLPSEVRADHQLVIVCAMTSEVRQIFVKLVQACGLGDSEVVLTGFVSEQDLVTLYRECKAFVFPSWYEGFGLPVLEAMVAGRAVIGSATSSIPEVIGRDDALFDPNDVASISAAIHRVLTDDEFRTDLEQWAALRAPEFSWDNTADVALAAMRALPPRPQARTKSSSQHDALPPLAYLSPLPPSASGIADYSAELLPELAKFYDITLVVADGHPAAADLGFPVASVQWFRANHRQFDRVLYQFGNSDFHDHMFGLLDEIPGVVVLHDFFLSGIIAHLDRSGTSPGEWTRSLYRSHGYHAVHDLAQAKGGDQMVFAYPANLRVLQAADGVIVHSRHSQQLAQQWYGVEAAADWHVIPLLREPMATSIEARAAARQSLGIGPDEFVVSTFGHAAPTKLVDRVVAGFAASTLATRPHARLVVAGEPVPGPFGEGVVAAVELLGGDRGKVTGRLSAQDYRNHLLACDVAVQLRTNSRGETSAAVLDCMNAGVAVIVNAHGSAADLPSGCVSMLPDEFTDQELAAAIEALADDAGRRAVVAEAGQALVHGVHSPAVCAAQYANVIERVASELHHRSGVRAHLSASVQGARTRSDVEDLAVALARSLPPRPRAAQWLVDVGGDSAGRSRADLVAGATAALRALLLNPPEGVRVEPVYATPKHGLRYARMFTARLLGINLWGIADDPVEFAAGDVFGRLDGAGQADSANDEVLITLRAAGVEIRDSLVPE